MSSAEDEEEYTFVEGTDKEVDLNQEVPVTKDTVDDKDDKDGEKAASSSSENAEEKEMPKLESTDSEVFELVPSGLRSRHQAATCGPCGSACRFDPLEMRDSDSTFEEEYAKINRDLDEEPANLHRWRAWLSMFFLVVMTGPPIAAFFLTAKEWVDPLVRLVPADDSEQVKDIFFGGTAWLVSCITNKSATKPPRVLEAAAEVLRPRGVRVARVHCWHPIETKKGKRTLAQRFGFREKPPVVMATNGKAPPTFVAATGLNAEALAAKVLAAVIPDAELPKASIRDRKRVDPDTLEHEEAEALARRVMEVLQSLEPNHIPPIVATICRVPMKEEDREEVIRELLVKWLRMLEQEKEHPTGAVTIQQILSLAVSLGLSPDIVNTAVFTKEVFDFIGNRFHLLRAEEIIVFLWAIQRLVVPKSSTANLARGLKQVQKLWTMLSASSELSLQRLIQLSEVLTCVKAEAKGSLPHWTGELEELQELVIQDLAESVQYCQSDTLSQILEIWHGSEDFWSQHTEFAEAIAKRIEELLLEFTETTEILRTFQAALSAPGLVKSLSERAIEVLSSALSSRGADDLERVQAVVAGTPWEVLCKGTPASAATASEAPPVEVQPGQLVRIDRNKVFIVAVDATGRDFLAVIPGVGNMLMRGPFSDINRGWYVVVGATILTNLLLNMFMVPGLNAVGVILSKFMRCCCRGRVKHHSELVQYYTNPEFDLKTKYAQLLTTVCVTLMYSSGLPLLYLIGFGYMALMYWSDKITLLWYSKRPPHYDAVLAKNAAEAMLYAIALHCIFAVVMFGQPCVFPSQSLGGDLGSLIEKNAGEASSALGDFWPRLTQESTWMFVAFFAVLLALWVIWWLQWAFAGTFGAVLQAMWALCCASHKQQDADVMEAVKTGGEDLDGTLQSLGSKAEKFDVAEMLSWEEAKALIEKNGQTSSYHWWEHPAQMEIAHHMKGNIGVVPQGDGALRA
eukprot:s1076_g13.t1